MMQSDNSLVKQYVYYSCSVDAACLLAFAVERSIDPTQCLVRCSKMQSDGKVMKLVFWLHWLCGTSASLLFMFYWLYCTWIIFLTIVSLESMSIDCFTTGLSTVWWCISGWFGLFWLPAESSSDLSMFDDRVWWCCDVSISRQVIDDGWHVPGLLGRLTKHRMPKMPEESLIGLVCCLIIQSDVLNFDCSKNHK